MTLTLIRQDDDVLHRVWTEEEIEAAKNDAWLQTLLLNRRASLREHEYAAYPKQGSISYRVEFANVRPSESIVYFHATDDTNALRFLEERYPEREIEALCVVRLVHDWIVKKGITE